MLPKRVSICMWKSWFACHPIDTRIQAVGVQMASRCDGCPNGKIESLDHLFCKGSFAQEVWKQAAMALGVNCMATNIWKARVNF